MCEVDRRPDPFIDGDEIEHAIAVEIRRFGHPDRRVRRTERDDSRRVERSLRTGQVHATLPAVAEWHREVSPSVAIEVGGGDRRRGLARERNAIAVEAATSS